MDDFELESILNDIRDGPEIKQRDQEEHSVPANFCQECCIEYIISDMCYECPDCHKIVEIEDSSICNVGSNKYKEAFRGRMRIMGVNSSKYQSDMDKNTASKSIEYQIRVNYNDLIKMNIDHEAHGYKPLPKNILHNVATIYSDIQQKVVKRSTAKRKIIAALVYRACVSENFIKLSPEVTAFAKLSSHGMAEGDNFVRSMHDKGVLDIDINEDRLVPHVVTIFNQIGLSGPDYTQHQQAVVDIVDRAISKRIGNESVLRSKSVAATYNVLKRANIDITLNTIKDKCKIRIYTIRRFLNELTKKHKHFKKIYKKYGLNTDLIDVWT